MSWWFMFLHVMVVHVFLHVMVLSWWFMSSHMSWWFMSSYMSWWFMSSYMSWWFMFSYMSWWFMCSISWLFPENMYFKLVVSKLWLKLLHLDICFFGLFALASIFELAGSDASCVHWILHGTSFVEFWLHRDKLVAGTVQPWPKFSKSLVWGPQII